MARSVAAFFDAIAHDYARRYDEERPFLRYMHEERLRFVLEACDWRGCSVLDVGAGTGALYDALAARDAGSGYFACDVSAAMLAQSRIPSTQRFVGPVEEAPLGDRRFDRVVCLGVTTYMERASLDAFFDVVARVLSDDGIAFVTFTHAGSVDARVRRRVQGALSHIPFAARLVEGRVLSRDEYATTARAIGARVPPELVVDRVVWQHFGVTPVKQLAPRASVRLARAIGRAPARIQRALAADFLIVIRRATR